MSDMNGKLALVTGGASGIGKAVVQAFVQRGCRVIIFDVQDEKAENLCNELNRDDEKVFYRHVNLFSNEEIEAGFQWIQSGFGQLDYAHNNAGFGIPMKLLGDVTDDEITKVIHICLVAVIRCMVQELRMMTKNGHGRIVNTTSDAGVLGSQYNAVYSAAKHGVTGVTKSAALDYADQNITVNAAAPGAAETELLKGLKVTAPETYRQSEPANPAGRLARPEEPANAVMFLCADESSFINGITIPVDSGYCAGPYTRK